jgi:hypothetical protein
MVSNKIKNFNLVMLPFIKSPHVLSLQNREKGWLISNQPFVSYKDYCLY